MYEALLQYGEVYGHCNVPRRFECQLPDGLIQY